MKQEKPFTIHKRPNLRNPSMIIAWSLDAGRLGSKVIDLLNHELGGVEIAEMNTSAFFFNRGVQIENNIVQYPESKFYYCEGRDLLLFKSDAPVKEWYQFLNSILDIGMEYYRAKEILTLGGFISSLAHTSTRRTIGVVSQPELKTAIQEFVPDIDSLEYQTPPGSRPTLNSYLIWVAKKRNIACTNFWMEVPYYLASSEDPIACKDMLGILNRKFNLGLALDDLDEEIRTLNVKFDMLKIRNPYVGRYIEMLEKGIMLNQEESEKLAKDVAEFLS